VDAAERTRREGQLAAYLKQTDANVSDRGLEDLEAALRAAEHAHVYIQQYGEPGLLPREREFYLAFLERLRISDRAGTINHHTREHVAASEAIHVVPLLDKAH
jgi:hypothetical protein